MDRITTDRILKSDGTGVDIAVASTADVYTHSVFMAWGESFAVSMRAKSSTGTPDIDLYIEQTHVYPANGGSTYEGSAGDTTNGWAAAEGTAKLLDITDENWHHLTISPLALPYFRLKLDGQGANPADCTVELHISKLEDF